MKVTFRWARGGILFALFWATASTEVRGEGEELIGTPAPEWTATHWIHSPWLSLHSLRWVVGIEMNGYAKAYPFSALAVAEQPIHDRIGGIELMVEYNPAAQSARVIDSSGRPTPSVTAYWFAWAVFHPKTEVFGSLEKGKP